jgi:ferredoxin-thioredoxin reductase catalytic chain
MTPSDESVKRIEKYVMKYWEKTGTFPHPNKEITDAVVGGLAINLDVLGKPLCPCNFYPDKEEEAKNRRWLCACDEMKKYKYCHCLLFVTKEGLPVTEYLPEDHEGRKTYGVVKDQTPDRGREGKK